MHDMSFQEKQISATLITTLILFGSYFVIAFETLFVEGKPDLGANLILLFSGAVVLMIVAQIIMHILFAVLGMSEKPDERDRLIELKATRISYFVLVVGVWVTASTPLFWSSVFLILNVMILAFMLSAVVGQVAQLVMYRRGA